MKEKKIDNETILIGAMLEIKEIADTILKSVAQKEGEKVLTAQKEFDRAETGLREAKIHAESEPIEEIPEIVSEEDADLSRPIVKNISVGDPEEKVEMPEDLKKIIEEAEIKEEIENKPRENKDYMRLEEFQEQMKLHMQKDKEIAHVKKKIEEGVSREEAVKSLDEIPEIEAKLSEAQIKPVFMETMSKCPKCNSKLNHQSKIERIGDGFFAMNTITCSNKGKKSWKGKIIAEPCDYISQSVIRID
jgi:murein L,D-transpeptidase YcbB/YkuD